MLHKVAGRRWLLLNHPPLAADLVSQGLKRLGRGGKLILVGKASGDVDSLGLAAGTVCEPVERVKGYRQDNPSRVTSVHADAVLQENPDGMIRVDVRVEMRHYRLEARHAVIQRTM